MTTLEIFYNEIIPEASNGNIKSYFTYNVVFDTYIKEDDRKISGNINQNGVITPLLIINNKSLFNSLLEEYVELALNFYKDSRYLQEIKNESELYKENVDIRKNILAMLWSNATFDDFSNPIEFLQKRISFLNSEYIECNDNYGYIELLNGELNISIKKDEVYNETPYQFCISIVNSNGEVFNLPNIKFGIKENTLYIYAIQNKENEKNDYSKKINRLLYKIGEGFNELEDTASIYGISNLKDISASFLVALNIIITYFKNLGMEKVVASSILLTRWNAKRIAINKRYQVDCNKYELALDEQMRIQSNLTEKFLRTFMRLQVHYKEMETIAYPFDIDSNLHIDISKMHSCNNTLLRETSEIINNKKDRPLV